MDKVYLRDMPDGSRQTSYEPLKRLPKDEPYFDDFISVSCQKKNVLPLEIYHVGRERSYPERTLHRIPNVYIMHYVTKGRGTVNGKTVREGQGFLCFPDRPHTMSSDSEEPWHFKWITFGGSDAKRLIRSFGIDERNYIFDFDFTEEMEQMIDGLLYGKRAELDISTYLCGMFYFLLSHHKKISPRDVYEPSLKYVSAAVEYIDKNYREDIKVEDIAKGLHISRKHLTAVFCRTMGMSTKDYLILKRLSAASNLLVDTDMPIAEIAREAGYSDYTQFSRLFKAKRGMSPKDYRKNGYRDIGSVVFIKD